MAEVDNDALVYKYEKPTKTNLHALQPLPTYWPSMWRYIYLVYQGIGRS